MEGKATLAHYFPQTFSQLPDNIHYAAVENFPTNDLYEDMAERLNEIDLSLQMSSKKKKSPKSKYSFSTRSSHSNTKFSTKSSRTITSDMFTNSTSMNSEPNNNVNTQVIVKSPIPISHIVKKKKVKRRKPAKRFPVYQMSPKENRDIPQERQKIPKLKSQLLPMTILYPGYILRFNYQPKEIYQVHENEGCPTIINYRNGDVETQFKDGTRQIEHNKDKYIYFFNGDIQHNFPDGSVAYKYASNNSIEFTHYQGRRILQLANGERYTYYPNSKIEITYHKTDEISDTFNRKPTHN